MYLHLSGIEPELLMPEPIDITVCALYHCTIEALIHTQNLCYICHLWPIWEKVVILKAYRALVGDFITSDLAWWDFKN